MNFRYPNINGGTVQERLAQIERHLYGLTNDLNYAVVELETAKGTESVSTQASAGGGGGGGGNPLQPGAVTTNIIADGAVTNAKIADGTRTAEKMAFSVPSMLDIYPIGAVYLSVNAVSPETLFGGRWERIQDKFLLAASENYAAGSTGGEVSHVLTIDEMPAHTHKFDPDKRAIVDMGEFATKWGVHWETVEGYYCTHAQMQSTGGGQAHNNMPPYIAVYMWKRTA